MFNDPDSTTYLDRLGDVAASDVAALLKAQKNYGNSWKKRGGVGAFMMLARKWDRLENFLAKMRIAPDGEQAVLYDIFSAIAMDQRAEGVIDDIRDLRRYLMLVEAEMRARGACPGALAKDAEPPMATQDGPDAVFAAAGVPRATPKAAEEPKPDRGPNTTQSLMEEFEIRFGVPALTTLLARYKCSVPAQMLHKDEASKKAFQVEALGLLRQNDEDAQARMAHTQATEGEQPTASQLNPQ